MQINFEKIEQATGRKFDNTEQLYFYIQYIAEFLKVNNQNYTQKQQEKVDQLFEIVRAVDFSGSDSGANNAGKGHKAASPEDVFRMICASLPRQPENDRQSAWSDGCTEILCNSNNMLYILRFLKQMGIGVTTGFHSDAQGENADKYGWLYICLDANKGGAANG